MMQLQHWNTLGTGQACRRGRIPVLTPTAGVCPLLGHITRTNPAQFCSDSGAWDPVLEKAHQAAAVTQTHRVQIWGRDQFFSE